MGSLAGRPYHLPWADLDRGLISHHGRVLHPCSEPFLVELCSSIYEASESEEVYVPGSRAGTIFRAGMEEIERLEAHPLLIPDPSLRMRFGALAEEIRERHERARKARELAVAAHEIAREEEEIIDGVNHPMFRPDLKPWEQFLLKDSPGSGLTLPDHPPHVMYQVMPYAGALLKENWMKTLVELEERILNAPLPANVARREGPVQEPAVPTSGLDIHCSLHRFPNLYKEKFPPQLRSADVVDNLESFNDIIDGLEGTPYLSHLVRPNTHVLLYRSINPELELQAPASLEAQSERLMN